MDLWNILYFMIASCVCYGIYAFYNHQRFKIFILGCRFMINRLVRPSTSIKRSSKYLEIAYTENGKPKTLLIPTNLSQAFAASQCEVVIHYDHGSSKDLIQDCDIPILVTANDLGARSITVYNTATGEERMYTGNNPVLYF